MLNHPTGAPKWQNRVFWFTWKRAPPVECVPRATAEDQKQRLRGLGKNVWKLGVIWTFPDTWQTAPCRKCTAGYWNQRHLAIPEHWGCFFEKIWRLRCELDVHWHITDHPCRTYTAQNSIVRPLSTLKNYCTLWLRFMLHSAMNIWLKNLSQHLGDVQAKKIYLFWSHMVLDVC